MVVFVLQFTRAGEARGEWTDLQRISGARRAAQSENDGNVLNVQIHEHAIIIYLSPDFIEQSCQRK